MKKLILIILGTAVLSGAFALDKPVKIKDQGSFFAGGTVVTGENGLTLHGDHAYAFYQIPVKARKLPIVFLHGANSSGSVWETTPDGRDGFQNIFLSRRYSVYLVDQARRGRASKASVSANIPANPGDQIGYAVSRIGSFPGKYDGVQFPTDEASLNQSFRNGVPDVGGFDADVASSSVAAVVDRAGDSILVSHSQGGGVGWDAVMKTGHIKAVISLEPGSGFVFPEGEVPEAMPSTSLFGPLSAEGIPLSDFEKLTKIPILLIYGDNIPSYDDVKGSDEWNLDNWRTRLEMARLWVKAINDHGGNAQLIHLPEIGIYGNTHSLFQDKNNVQIADVMEKWLHEQKLDK